MYFLSGKAASPTKKYGRVRPPSGSGPGKHKVSLSKDRPKIKFTRIPSLCLPVLLISTMVKQYLASQTANNTILNVKA